MTKCKICDEPLKNTGTMQCALIHMREPSLKTLLKMPNGDSQKPCIHKHVKIMDESRYTFPQGYKEAEISADFDLADYYVECNQAKVICEDCAEQLD